MAKYERLEPNPGTCGTVGYLAPELESLSYSRSGTYDTAVDIWSLGVIGIGLFRNDLPWTFDFTYNHRNPFRVRTDETAEARSGRMKRCDEIALGVNKLKAQHWSSIENLLGKMLQFDPADRISAHDALQHRALEEDYLSYREINQQDGKRKH